MQEQSPFYRLLKYLWQQPIAFSFAASASVFSKILCLMPPLIIGWIIATLSHKPPHWLTDISHNASPIILSASLAFVAMLLYFSESIMQWYSKLRFMHIAQQAQHQLRLSCYEKIQNQELNFFKRHHSGELQAIVNNDINQLERFLNGGFNQILQLFVLVIFSSYILFSTSFYLSLIGISALPLLIVGGIIFKKHMKMRYDKVRKNAGKISATLKNNFENMQLIKSYAAEDYELNRLNQVSNEYSASNIHAIKLSSLFTPSIRAVIAIFFGVMLLVGSYGILTHHSTLSIANFVVVIMIMQRLLWPLSSLGNVIDDLERAKASCQRVFSLMDEALNNNNFDGDIEINNKIESIELKHVNFSYESRPVLSNVNLSIYKNEVVVLTGKSGVGKSTLVSLLLRFQTICQGEININYYDINKLKLKHLREKIAFVAQDLHVVSGSIRDNIIYNNPINDDIKMMTAAKAADIHDYILSLPEGYDTPVGEKANFMSGGLLQRLNLARAFYKDADVIILDEATSALDITTESTILKNMQKQFNNKIIIIITHRDTSFAYADKIFKLIEGGIITVKDADQHEVAGKCQKVS